MSVNKVILVGNLGKDPEVKHTSDQRQVVSFSIATNERRKNGQTGEWTDHTEWHRVVTFGKLAEICSQYLTKGKQIYLEGKLRTNKWTDKDGNTRYTTEVIGDQMRMLGRKGDAPHAVPSEPYGGGHEANAGSAMLNSIPTADQIAANSGKSGSPEITFEDDDIPF